MLWVWLVACKAPEPAAPAPFDPVLADDIRHAFDDAFATLDAPGATLAVHVPGEGVLGHGAGLSVVDPALDARAEHIYKIASITKTFTATAAMQRVEAGELSLDDTVGDWLPGELEGWHHLTAEQLLGHSSGLVDHASSPRFLAGTGEERTAREILALIEDEPLLFEPGTDHSYSNSNYFLLALILEQATDQSWKDLVRSGVIEPLNLSVRVPSEEDAHLDGRGYAGTSRTGYSESSIHPSSEGAGGELSGSALDLVALGRALLLDDRLVQPHTLERMTTPIVPGAHYGLGLYIDPAPDGGRWLGHSGSTVSWQSRLRVHEERGIVVVCFTNNFFAEADVLDAAVWDVLLE